MTILVAKPEGKRPDCMI